MLPLVADMAALLAEGDHDLKARVGELNALLHRLRDAIHGINDFLIAARKEMAEMDGMYTAMASELNQNQKAAANITQLLASTDATAARQREQIDAIDDALNVIRRALEASLASADGVDTETGLLRDSIRDYVDILAWRKDPGGWRPAGHDHAARLEMHRDARPEIELPAAKRRLQLKDR